MSFYFISSDIKKKIYSSTQTIYVQLQNDTVKMTHVHLTNCLNKKNVFLYMCVCRFMIGRISVYIIKKKYCVHEPVTKHCKVQGLQTNKKYNCFVEYIYC